MGDIRHHTINEFNEDKDGEELHHLRVARDALPKVPLYPH